MVRIIEGSEIEVHFDCERIDKMKLEGTMLALPHYVEARLAHSVELDFWTSSKLITSRFVVSQISTLASHHKDPQLPLIALN